MYASVKSLHLCDAFALFQRARNSHADIARARRYGRSNARKHAHTGARLTGTLRITRMSRQENEIDGDPHTRPAINYTAFTSNAVT